MASTSPVPERWEELLLGWAEGCQVIGGGMGCWQWARGYHPSDGTQDTTTLPHQHLDIAVSTAPRTSPPHQHSGHHCLMAPRTSFPRRCHPMPSQRCPRSPSTPHHGLKEPGWSHSHPKVPGDSRGPTPSASSPGFLALGTGCSPQPPNPGGIGGQGCTVALTPPAAGPGHPLTHNKDDFVVLEFFWRRERKKPIIKSQKACWGRSLPRGQDLGQASLGWRRPTPGPRGIKAKWEAATCPPHPCHLGRSGRLGGTRLSTKTPWHLGHGAGIPLLRGILEMVTVHGSTAGGDRPHPSHGRLVTPVG